MIRSDQPFPEPERARRYIGSNSSHRSSPSLAEHDERKARVLELRYFAGLSVEETTEAMGLSVATVGREARFAAAWLRRELLGEKH